MQQEYLRQLPGQSLSTNNSSFLARFHLDTPLLLNLFVLASFGLFILYSATNGNYDAVTTQATRVGIGFTVLLVLAQIPPRVFRFWAPALYSIGLTLLVLVLLVGTQKKGAQRWLTIPGIAQFQPAELVKVAVPAMVAWYFHDRQLPARFRDVFLALMITCVPAALIALQPDLGTALLVAVSGLIVLFMAGLSWRLITLAAGTVAVAAP